MKKEILVIDDTAQNLSIISELLKDIYKVKVATSGKKALSYLETSKAPDLILLDVILPGIKGREVCRRLKEDPRTSAIPVVFLTAKDSPDDVQAEKEVGATSHLTKPVSPRMLISTVRDILSA